MYRTNPNPTAPSSRHILVEVIQTRSMGIDMQEDASHAFANAARSTASSAVFLTVRNSTARIANIMVLLASAAPIIPSGGMRMRLARALDVMPMTFAESKAFGRSRARIIASRIAVRQVMLDANTSTVNGRLAAS
jgi:hypothetical protein